MLTAVKVRNPQGEELVLYTENVSSGLAVADIDGLDPVKATLVSSSFATIDGQRFQSSRRESRNIVLKLSMEPNYVTTTIQSIRDLLYRMFMTETTVTLIFTQSDGPDLEIVGVIESFDAPRFARDLLATVSIMCFAPNLLDKTPRSVNVPSASSTVATWFEYGGTVEAGTTISFTVGSIPMDWFSIAHVRPDGEVERLEFAGMTLNPGDTVSIVSLPGEKNVTVRVESTTVEALWAMQPGSAWISLRPGRNGIALVTDWDVAMGGLTAKVDYIHCHGGV
jgi:hypothetical protein